MKRRFFHFVILLAGLGIIASGSLKGAVSLGIDELEKSNFAILQGKRVGLITNPSGSDSKGHSAIDVLFHGSGHGYKLVRLFGPEHGIDGLTPAGVHVSGSRDHKTGLPVYSLYGDTRQPTPEMLAGLDTLVFDVQDLGNRSYTFISTLGLAMDEAAKLNVEVIVLDRPNPLGGIRIEGPRLDPAVKSFVGQYDIPVVYGLTPGELAQWINAKFLAKPCRLTVVAMKGWARQMVWEDTGLKWIPTSPNIPTIGAARGYSATGFLGEIGIESGIGSSYPFQIISGRGWNTSIIASRFNALHIAGVHASPYNYSTSGGKWSGSEYQGIFLKIDPHNAGNLTGISLQAIEILENNVSNFIPFSHTSADQRQMFDKVTGTTSIRRQLLDGRPVKDMMRSWDGGVARWAVERLPYLLYGTKSNPSNQSAPTSISAAVAP